MHEPPVDAIERSIAMAAHLQERDVRKDLETFLTHCEDGHVIMKRDTLQATLQRVVEAHGHEVMHVIVGRPRSDDTYTITCNLDPGEDSP